MSWVHFFSLETGLEVVHINIEFTFSFLLWDKLQSSLDVMCISLICEWAWITENPLQQVVPFQNIIISRKDSPLFLSGGFWGIIFLKSQAAPGQCKNTDHQHSVRQNRCAYDLWHLNAAYYQCKMLAINCLKKYTPKVKVKLNVQQAHMEVEFERPHKPQ